MLGECCSTKWAGPKIKQIARGRSRFWLHPKYWYLFPQRFPHLPSLPTFQPLLSQFLSNGKSAYIYHKPNISVARQNGIQKGSPMFHKKCPGTPGPLCAAVPQLRTPFPGSFAWDGARRVGLKAGLLRLGGVWQSERDSERENGKGRKRFKEASHM